ncbi:MAG: ATP-dependent sacrificial sulfur transferase LarE, partial [Deltaproteobacteria bacterium]|nr:ATP-dependent sacrificial sulfur transferase LarE [Deltaproteobacteria bacterium]
PPERCYFCKQELFSRLGEIAAQEKAIYVLDGTNLDDLGDFRPGRKAAQELGVRSPLLEAGLTKDDIRFFSRELGLTTWDKPACACLSSRFPYGTRITPEKLSQVERGEDYLRSLGFIQFRLRHHGDVVRIEIGREEFPRLLAQADEVARELKAAGFTYVALDLEGYRTGSMNETLGTGRNMGNMGTLPIFPERGIGEL